MEDVRSFKASVRDNVDYLARIDGAPVGSAAGVIFSRRADRVFTIVTMLAGQRRQGGFRALSGGLPMDGRAGLSELEVEVLDGGTKSHPGAMCAPSPIRTRDLLFRRSCWRAR
jgi:hypothetical protein